MENFTYISDKSIFIENVNFSIDSEIEVFYFGEKVPFVLNVIDSSKIELQLLGPDTYSVLFVKINDSGVEFKLETSVPTPVVSDTNSLDVLSFFKFTTGKILSLGKASSFKLLIEVYDDLFVFPDFSKDLFLFTESDFSSNILNFEFLKDFLYKITLTVNDVSGTYIYISEKPSAYFCNTAELKRFFESDKYISNLYTTEEYPLIIWKKSLEIPVACSFPATMKITPDLLPMFSKYVIYACCVDLLFFLLNNTTSDNVDMFRSLDKVSLGQFAFSGSSNTPYDSYSTSHMRFVRQLDSISKEIREYVACVAPEERASIDFHNPFQIRRIGSL